MVIQGEQDSFKSSRSAYKPLHLCSFNCGPKNASISTTRELVRNAESGAPGDSYAIKISEAL